MMMMKLRTHLFKFAAIRLNCVAAIGGMILSLLGLFVVVLCVFFFFMSLCLKRCFVEHTV